MDIRITECSTDLALVRILDGQSPDSRRLFLRCGVGLVGVDDPTRARLEVVGRVRACVPERRLRKGSLGVDIEARQRNGERVAIATHLVHGDLERRRRCLALCASNSYSISFDLFELDRFEAARDVRAQVARRTDLIQQLTGDGLDIHDAAGAIVLADHAAAISGNIRPRESEPGPTARCIGAAFDLVKERVVTAGRLTAAFDHVPSDDGAGKLVEVGALPAVMPGGRSAHDSCVGDATGDHDVGTLVERFDDAECAEVGVGAHVLREVPEVAAFDEGVQRARCGELLDPGQQVVAVDVRDRRVEAELLCDLVDGISAAVRIEPAGIRHDLDALVEARTHDLFHLGHERAGIPTAWVLRLNTAEDEHRQFGQPVAGENVDLSAFNLFTRPGRSIAKEAGTVRNADRVTGFARSHGAILPAASLPTQSGASSVAS